MVGTIAVAVGLPLSYTAISSALRTAPDKSFAWLAALISAASLIGIVVQFIAAARG